MKVGLVQFFKNSIKIQLKIFNQNPIKNSITTQNRVRNSIKSTLFYMIESAKILKN
jgi:hypothetical protein